MRKLKIATLLTAAALLIPGCAALKREIVENFNPHRPGASVACQGKSIAGKPCEVMLFPDEGSICQKCQIQKFIIGLIFGKQKEAANESQ